MSKDPNKYGFDIIKSNKGYKPKVIKKSNKKESEKALIFSKKIISALEEKVIEFNKNNSKKLTISQLKKAYKSGFNNNSKDLNLEALANVNLFLRISEGKVNLLNNFKLNFFEIVGNTVDIKGSISPEEIDYNKAKEDIKNYKLENFDFKSLEELYLEDEEDRVIFYNL